jgi:NDP-sugar pyrophosphorylase family protein
MTLPPIAILAGGLATRLHPITIDRPKAMVPVNGEPFCAVQLRQLRAQGFEHVIFLLGHLGDQIREFAGNGERFGLRIDYVDDGAQLRGTGGAVFEALPWLGDQFFVTYGDTLLQYDPKDVLVSLEQDGTEAVMLVLHNRDQWDRSNVVLEGGRVLYYGKEAADRSKVEWIDYGATLFRASALRAFVDHDAWDLGKLLALLAERRLLAGYEVTERFYEIGTPAARSETEHFLAARASGLGAD